MKNILALSEEQSIGSPQDTFIQTLISELGARQVGEDYYDLLPSKLPQHNLLDARWRPELGRLDYNWPEYVDPPTGNTGGNSEEPLTKNETTDPNAAFIDWARIVIPSSCFDTETKRFDEDTVVAKLFAELQYIMPGLEWGGEGRGRYFYDRCFKLKDIPGSFIAIGGNNGTCLIELSGAACNRVNDWGYLQALLETLGGKLVRVDPARDFFEGEYSVEDFRAMYTEGGFKITRQPKARYIDDLGSKTGSSLYVGDRRSGKLARIYDKAKQLGDKEAQWLRIEVEFLAQDRELPLDILTNPGKYLAGAYPCLNFISNAVERIKTIAKHAKIAYTKLKTEAKKGYGKLLNLMRNTGMTDTEIVDELVRSDGYPKRLLAIPDPVEVLKETSVSNWIKSHIKTYNNSELIPAI